MRSRAVVLSLSLLLFVSAAPVPSQPEATPQQASDWTFQGCFSRNGTLPCYDVYTHEGTYWICSTCGTTSRPSEKKCRILSAYELANGRWCS